MLIVLRQLNLKVNSATYMETGPAALYNHQKQMVLQRYAAVRCTR